MSAIPYQSFKHDFRFQRHLGKGNCAVVDQVYSQLEKKYYARKLIVSSSIEEISQALNQVEAVLALDHKNLAKIHYYYVNQSAKTNLFELAIIMDLCDLNLADAIKNRRPKRQYFNIDEIRNFLNSLIPLFAQMQKKGYLHRDIKPDNILLTKGLKKDFKVADFGFSLKQNCYSSRNVAGTKQYVSPKLRVKFENQSISVSGHNIKDDVYSLGKTLVDIMTLELGLPIIKKTLTQCRNRYGKEISTLLEMMIEESQSKRADFLTLETNLSSIQGNPIIKKQSEFLNRRERSIERSDSIPTINLLHPTKRRRPTTNSRTKKKGIQGSLETTLNLKCEEDSIKSLSRFRLIERKKSYKKKQVVTRGPIEILACCQDLIFMAQHNLLGVFITSTQRQVRISVQKDIRSITCLKVSPDEETLAMGTRNSKIFLIRMNNIQQVLNRYGPSMKINNIVDIPFNNLDCKEIDLSTPPSSIQFLPQTQQQPCLLVGHSSGQLSQVSQLKVDRKVTVMNSAVTQVTAGKGYIFTSNYEGVFKRQSAKSLNFDLCQSQAEISKLDFYSNSYICESCITSFILLNDCQTNKSIPNKEDHYYAALMTSRGYLHIVSEKMKCEKMVRVCYSQTAASLLKLSPHNPDGFEGLVLGTKGELRDEKGTLISEIKAEKMACLTENKQSIICGSYDKKLIMLQYDRIEID